MRNILLSLVIGMTFSLFFPLTLHTAPDKFGSNRLPIETEAPTNLPALKTSALTSFNLTLSIENATDLGGFELDIVYNRAVADITQITPQTFFGQSTQCNPALARCGASLGPVHKSGASRIGAYSYGGASGVNGSGILALIRVETNADPDSLTFTIANPLVVDTQGAPITQNVTLHLTRSTGGQIFLPSIRR